MTKRWMGWALFVAAVALSATASFACDQQAQADGAKDAKAAAANGEMKGCDMPCCAHAKDAAEGQAAVAAAVPAGEKPCAAHDSKGCPKKAGATAAAAKAEAPSDAAKVQPVAEPGTHR